MKRAAGALAQAFSYFTIVPAGRFSSGPDADALAWLPLVGAVVGAIAGSAGWVAGRVAHQPWGGLAAFAFAIVLTGAIHVDGFMDSCDALLATVTPDRRLEILDDPRHGTYAIAGFAIAALFWIFSLFALPWPRCPLLLAFTGATARLAVIPNAWIFPYARPHAVTRAFAARPSPVVFLLLLALAELLAFLISPRFVAAVPIAIALAVVLGWAASRRLGGGLTGDVYGFCIVCVEVALLVALVFV